jgi:hypothetical protein
VGDGRRFKSIIFRKYAKWKGRVVQVGILGSLRIKKEKRKVNKIRRKGIMRIGLIKIQTLKMLG